MSVQQIYNAERNFVAAIDAFTSTGNGTPVEIFESDVTFQISGSATAITATLYRSTLNPGSDGSAGNWAPSMQPFREARQRALQLLYIWSRTMLGGVA